MLYDSNGLLLSCSQLGACSAYLPISLILVLISPLVAYLEHLQPIPAGHVQITIVTLCVTNSVWSGN